MMEHLRRFRQLAGVIVKDWSRYRRALNAAEPSYLSLCNRDEVLEPSPDGAGYRCQWQWTSQLHAPRFLPGLGARLMQRALQDHPVRRADHPPSPGPRQAPDITYVVGHRGSARVPLLLATLQTIAAQRDATVECVVVDQDWQPGLAARLPAWVRYVHTPPPTHDMPYCRSWALNVGAKQARSGVLVLHDNDMLVPEDYSRAILSRVSEGFQVINLKRFVFYLDEAHTAAVLANQQALTGKPPAAILQNAEGGGSIAITTAAFFDIGGMDESFIGWGGEDNEFWERAQTLRCWPYAHLPLVHLWHPAQPGKHEAANQTLAYYKSRTQVAAPLRVEQLRTMSLGALSGPQALKRA